MESGRARHLFPGGNTSLGFFSYYDYILRQDDALRIMVIKGGPGVGKSTFMKKIGDEMLNKGFDVEFMHCSSDNGSLDGVVIPKIKVALIDGTAPHIVDPKNPGAVDEIIHLGDFWDEENLMSNKKEVLSLNREVGRLFEKAYRYIKAAALIYDDIAVVNKTARDDAKLNFEAYNMTNQIFGSTSPTNSVGTERKLFASAITPLGLINNLNSLLTEKNFAIKGQCGTGAEFILEKVKSAALERGYLVEAFYCALNPYKLEHLVIPELKISILTCNSYHSNEDNIYKTVNINDYLQSSIVKKHEYEVEYNYERFDELLGAAVSSIKNAKMVHDEMEKYYIGNMNFDAVEERRKKVCEKIFSYIKK